MRTAPAAVLAAALLVAAGGRPAAAGPCDGVPRRTSADFAAPGPFAVGVRTFELVDTSRPTPANGTYRGAPTRTLPTEVWYPAAAPGRDAPLEPRGAPYPVVLYSHGFSAFRTAEDYLAEHLASRGYVVAAPDFPLSNFFAPGGPTVDDIPNQPGDQRFVLAALLAFSADPAHPLAGAVDGERVAASGLSLGGLTTLLLTYHRDLREPLVRAALAMAAPGCMFTRRFFRAADVPLLLFHGDSDQLVPFRQNALALFRKARRPRTLVQLHNGSHTGFTSFAASFDPSRHYDEVGCMAVANITEDDPFPSLGGRRAGVNAGRRCRAPCARKLPERPALVASRHHELVRIVAAAFFAAQMEGDRAADCFLRRQLARENREVRLRGGR